MDTRLEEFTKLMQNVHAAADVPEKWLQAYASITRWIQASPTLNNAPARMSSESQNAVPASAPEVDPVIVLVKAYFEIANKIQAKLAEAVAGQLAIAGLDQWTAAAYIVDAHGVVYHRNASAQAILVDVSVMDSKLKFRKPGFSNAFEAALRDATQEQPRTSVLPFSSAAEGLSEMTVSPLRTADTAGIRLALVVITRPAADARAIARRGRQVYGLTHAEARVMSELALGATVDEIAVIHNVRPATVRAQVRSIFEKTGVNRQSDLIRLALSTASLLSDRERS